MKIHGATFFMALAAAAVAVPLAAAADPPAATVPRLPGPFIGAPTNDGPDGQFSVNFDDRGRLTGIGSAPEHYADFDLTPERGHLQARAAHPTRESSADVAVFAAFRHRLRDVASPRAAAMQPTAPR